MARVAIVGEHWSTLSAAARLAVAGHDVDLIKTNSVSDTPLNITLPAALRDLFLKTGSPLEDSVELKDLDTMFTFTLEGTSFAMPGVGIGAAVSAITERFGQRSGTQWKSLMTAAQIRWDSIRHTVEDPLPNARPSWWKPKQSLSRQLRGTSEPVQAIVHKSLEIDGPKNEPLTAQHIVLPYVASTFGMYAVQGGSTALHRALLDRCLALGVHRRESLATADIVVTDSRFEKTEDPTAVDIDIYRRVGPQVSMSVLAGSAVSKAINERLRLNGG